jgi:cytochrome c peroxidase
VTTDDTPKPTYLKIGDDHASVVRRWRRRRLRGARAPSQRAFRGRFPMAAACARQRRAFQVPTLRNVDKRPYPTFVKAYAHDGYFKSLKSIVHFYNTRDVAASVQSQRLGLRHHMLASP